MNPYTKDHLDQVERVAAWLHKSGRTTLVRPEACAIVILDASIRGMTIEAALAEKHQTEFGPFEKAHLMLAKVRKRGGTHDVISRTPDEAAIRLTVRAPDKTAQVGEFRFTWQEAQAEPFVWKQRPTDKAPGIYRAQWASPRGRMQLLWARVVSDAVRTMCPEVLADVPGYNPDIEDDEAPDATQADPQAPTLAEALLGPPPGPPTTPATTAPAASDDGDLGPVTGCNPPAAAPPPAAPLNPRAQLAAHAHAIMEADPSVAKVEARAIPAPETPLQAQARAIVKKAVDQAQATPAQAAPPAATVAPVTGCNPPTDGRLDGTTLAALGTAIGPDLGDRAVKFLAGLGWIQNNDIATLTPDRAASIIRRAEAFRAKVEATITAP